MEKKPPQKPLALAIAIAALGTELAAGDVPVDVRLIPAGEFRSRDGRPTECAAWVMTDEDGARLVADAEALESAYVIDYEHATLHSKKTGEKAVAGGWYKKLEWRPGDGLWAIGVDWTALAAQHIASREYRYISPVFSYDKSTGRVQKLFHAALTNDPGLDGLTDLAALAAQFLTPEPSAKENGMEQLCEQCCYLLNLPVGTTPEEICKHLQKIIDQLKGAGAAAMSFNLADHLVALQAKIDAPDPAKFVPMEAHAVLQNQLSALQATVEEGDRSRLLKEALDDGRILPATEEYWKAQPLAALTAFLKVAQPVAVLAGLQSGGNEPGGAGLDLADSQAMATAALKYQAEQAAAGISITTLQAVAHVTKQGA